MSSNATLTNICNHLVGLLVVVVGLLVVVVGALVVVVGALVVVVGALVVVVDVVQGEFGQEFRLFNTVPKPVKHWPVGRALQDWQIPGEDPPQFMRTCPIAQKLKLHWTQFPVLISR